MIAQSTNVAAAIYRLLLGGATLTFTILICALTDSYITSVYFFVYMMVFVMFSDNRWVQLWTLFTLLCFMFLFSWHGSLASDTFWALRLIPTAAGTSSCTSNPYVDLPYNPNGLLNYDNASAMTRHWAFCPYYDMRWADATNADFTGVDEDQVLDPHPGPCQTCDHAGQARANYKTNLGRGLANGWSPAADLHNTALCPGVERVITAPSLIGRGKPVCTHCSQLFVPGSDCDPVSSDWLCYIWCPAHQANQTFQVRFVAEVMLAFAVLVGAYVVPSAAAGLTNEARAKRGHSQ